MRHCLVCLVYRDSYKLLTRLNAKVSCYQLLSAYCESLIEMQHVIEQFRISLHVLTTGGQRRVASQETATPDDDPMTRMTTDCLFACK